MTVQNPNWPLIDVAVSFDSGPQSVMPAPHWCSVKARTLGPLNTQRGRQYELDQVQTGTWTGSLENTDGALDPGNASGPFYPKVLPYRAFRHRAQYPPTVNILTADQATAGKTSGLPLGTLPSWVSAVAATGFSLTTAAFTGASNEYLLQYGASAAIGGGVALTGFSVQPGASHAVQFAVSASANNGLQMQASIQWIGPTGSVISTSNGVAITATTSFAGAFVVATAPSNACGGVIRVLSSNSVATATNIAVTHVQVEYNTTTTTFVTPNTWYSVFTGYVERWPQSWSKNGQFGVSNLTVVDAFGYLSQQKLLCSAYEEALALGPSFLYPLDESAPAQPSIPTLFYELTSQRQPAGIKAFSGYPSEDITAGNSITATGGYLPQGIGGPTAQAVLHSGTYESKFIDLTAGGANPAGPTVTSWTRVIAFRTPNVPDASGLVGNILSLFKGKPDAGTGNNNGVQVNGNYDGAVPPYGGNFYQLQVYFVQAGALCASLSTAPANQNLSDGGWHLLVYQAQDPNVFHGWLDGVPMTEAFTSNFSTARMSGVEDWINQQSFGKQPTADVTVAEYAFAGEFPYLLSSAQVSRLYSTFRYGGSGLGSASSTTRYQDILRWASWAGLQATDSYTTGETTSYGPATEMNSPAASSGTDVVSMLQTVVDTEAGFHYVAADGTITFKSRRARYNQGTPQVVFGENTAGGEVPYTVAATGYDPTRIANDISAVQTQTSATVRAVDNNSSSAYGDIQLQRTVNTLDSYEQLDAAEYLLLRNSQPVQRIDGITVNVGANPSIFGTMLALELGSRVRVMRRPPLGAATIQVDGFVEQLNWTFDDKGNASVDLQISVNNSQQFWQLDSSTYSVLGSTTVIGY